MSTDDSTPQGEPYLTTMEGTLETMDRTLDSVEEGVDEMSEKIDKLNSTTEGPLREVRKLRRDFVLLSLLLVLEIVALGLLPFVL